MKVLVFQHVAVEHPGSFRNVIAAGGHTMHQIELDEGDEIPALDDYDVLLVMGGPMDVWEEEKHPWLTSEKQAIREWVTAARPYLGMCLGEQLLADALGGSVKPMTAPPEVGLSEITIVSDPIFAGITEICPCFQWHGAEVVTLPPGARLLATSPGCAVQAFAIGQHAYGLQFHMELTETTAAEWGALPEYAAALEAVQGEGALGRLATEVAENLPMLETAARTVFQNFLIIAEGVISRKSAA